VYFTLDGSIPDASSDVYTTPIVINNTTSIKAIAIDAQNNQSKVTLGSYILNTTTNLPVLHIVIDPFYLYNDEFGMYVNGTNGIPGPCQTEPRNYFQDWEYAADVMLYEKDRSLAFKESAGLSISGDAQEEIPKSHSMSGSNQNLEIKN